VVEAEALAAASGEEDDVVLERQPRPLGSRDPRHRRRPPAPRRALSLPALAWCASASGGVGPVLNF
jgi:hypothetical protein